MSNITMGRARVRRRVKTEMARLGSCVGHVAVGLMYDDGRRRVECRRRCLSRHLLDRPDRRAGISRTTDGIHHRAMQLIRRPASYHCAGRAAVMSAAPRSNRFAPVNRGMSRGGRPAGRRGLDRLVAVASITRRGASIHPLPLCSSHIDRALISPLNDAALCLVSFISDYLATRVPSLRCVFMIRPSAAIEF